MVEGAYRNAVLHHRLSGGPPPPLRRGGEIMTRLTHIDETGRARMVDVSDKPATAREALAKGRLRMAPETLQLALSGQGRKGEVMAAAEIAGVMAAKRTPDLIPMCHPLILSSVKVRVDPLADG